MAMQNLRDKLLKAGLVDKKQKSQVDTQDRRDKKQRGAAELAAEEAEKRRLFEEKLAAEAEAQQKKSAALAAERAEHEREQRIRSICDRWAVRESRPGTRRFYFTQRSGRICHLMLSEALCEKLRVGALAVIERVPGAADAPAATVIAGRVDKPQLGPKRSLLATLLQKKGGQPPPGQASETHVLVPPDAAERIAALDGEAVRFWARGSEPLGVLPESESKPESKSELPPPAATPKP